MKKQLLQTTFIFVFTFVSITIFAQQGLIYDKTYFDNFPSYEEVIEAFYTQNEFDYYDVYSVSFGKKYDGWYLILTDRKTQTIEEQRIWNGSKNQFEYLRLEARKMGGEEAVNKGLKQVFSAYKANFYAQYPVYGYHDYESDLIALLENEKNLSAALLDALARSYSSKALSTLIPSQFGIHKKEVKYDQTFNPKDIDKKLLNEVVTLLDKGIATFDKLSTKYPNYQTIVGNIRTKYYNEIVSAYYALTYSGQSAAAKKYLKKDLYNDFQLKTAINTLNTCGKNAFLFTHGDNDTYQLIYAQDKLGIRPDVKIINLSLANLGRYIHYIKQRYEVKTLLDMERYKIGKNNYWYLNSSTEVLDIRTLLQNIDKDETLYLDEKFKTIVLPSKNLSWTIDLNGLNKQQGILNKMTEQGTMEWKIDKLNLFKNELFVLDALAVDNWQSPIYFTLGSSRTFQNLGWNNLTKIEGFAYRMLPEDLHDIRVLEKNLLKKFDYGDISSIDWYSSENAIFFYQYMSAFLELLKANKDDAEKAVQILDKIEATFPHKSMPYKMFASSFAIYCYQLEMTERGDAYIETEIQKIHAYFDAIKDKKTLSTYDKQTISTILSAAKHLINTTIAHNRIKFDDLSKELQVYFDEYEE